MIKCQPYLIQRGSFKDADGVSEEELDIDSLIKFEYMGSAEFEFGALNKSYNRIMNSYSDYKCLKTDIFSESGYECIVFCKAIDKKEVVENILGLALNQFRLKEMSRFDIYFKKTSKLTKYEKELTTNFWLDIDNDYMFWFDVDENTSLIEKAMENGYEAIINN